MPIREGKAKLWFKTKQQQDQYDDGMMAVINPQSRDWNNQYYVFSFYRPQKQLFLDFTQDVKNQLNKRFNVSRTQYADKYQIGKRDHTFYRQWSYQKFGFAQAIGYLFLRELPIRNFYARSLIMGVFFTQFFLINWRQYGKRYIVVDDQWNQKHVKNFGIYTRMRRQIPPTLDNKLPQQQLWKLNQPGYQTFNVKNIQGQIYGILPKTYKQVQWDGTFNMPLQTLAHPQHQDNKFMNFIYQ